MSDKTDTPSEALVEASTFIENVTKAAALAQEATALTMQRQVEKGGDPSSLDPFNVAPALLDFQKNLAAHPEKMIDATLNFWTSQATLWADTFGGATGLIPKSNKAAPKVTDKRLADEAWGENIVFNYLKQSYLMSSHWMRDAVRQGDQDLPEDERQKLEFFTDRFVDALSPANFMATNPRVWKQTAEENGANLVRGMEQMLEDMKRGKGDVWISQTDMDAFEVGRNVAVTPGKVVFRNELFELLQYAPVTEKVHGRPLLIAPPWINKYYILDLNEKKSMVRWLVAQGYTVFIISWRNPQPDKADHSFADYVEKGLYAALDAVIAETGRSNVNVVGYCIGGTMLSTALAHMAKKKDKRINTATFFTAQADFKKAGDLRVFVDDTALAKMQSEAERSGGVIGAKQMATAFNMLRSNELIWNYVVNNYYLGKEPSAFDLLFWNADSTRMPAKCHIEYLRDFYRDNALADGKLKVMGETLDLAKITVPVYSICAREDHIAPAASVYRSVKLFGGPVKLVVGGSGHIAGIVNPPDPEKVKYQYWTNTADRDAWPETIDEWIEGATETPGSWWPDWDAWLSGHSGAKVAARQPGANLGVLGDAPGTYVGERSDD